MASLPNEVKNIVDSYIEALKRSSIHLQGVYLFGSYAKGNFNEWSDIDIAVVSDSFEGIRIKDRDKIRKITLSISSRIEVLPFNTSDFSYANPLAREIMESGIRLI